MAISELYSNTEIESNSEDFKTIITDTNQSNTNPIITNNTTFKIILVGDSSVGKTSIRLRYIEDIFQPDHKPTVGVDFHMKTVVYNKTGMKLSLWDTSGQERFKSITKSYYNNAHAVILCFDITNRLSFINLIYWMDSINTIRNKIAIALVGTKLDRSDYRKVSFTEANEFAKKIEGKYFEVSSMKNVNVGEVFDHLTKEMLEIDKKKLNYEREDIIKTKATKLLKFDVEEKDKNKNQKQCCL